MRIPHLLTLFFLLSAAFCYESANLEASLKGKSYFQGVINKLYNQLQKFQNTQDQDFKMIPPQSQRQAGLYSSDIKLNYMDEENSEISHIFRETFAIDDNNMFVTNFILLGLMECADLGYISLNKTSVESAVDALLSFRDKNQPDPTTPIYSFWSQINVNGTWSAYPQNLEGIVAVFEKLPPFLQKIVALIGWEPEQLESMVQAFTIPPDNDDSGLNIVLGTVLQQHSKQFPELAAKWASQNSNLKGLYTSAKKYAYRPLESKFPSKFSTNASDIIDPRTYFYIHEFIEANNQGPLAFFTTWLTNQNDQIDGVVSMPFNTNNVDLTVNANSLYGLNSLLTTLPANQAEDLFGSDADLRGIYKNVTNLLYYGINSGIVLKRIDLVLTYYPSEFDFYWFVSRNVHLLRSTKINTGSLPYPEMDYALSVLEEVMLNKGIQQILSLAHYTDNNSSIYWEGFLGNYANQTRNEDSIFSTAVTLNALLDIYSYTSPDRTHRKFIKNTPESIKDIISKGINYITRAEVFDLLPSKINSFFSGSIKGVESLPYFYPSNYNMYKNNYTFVEPSADTIINAELINAVKGTFTNEQYNALLNETWWGYSTPIDFSGFNIPKDSFPFWSSEAITNLFMIQALSKFSSTS